MLEPELRQTVVSQLVQDGWTDEQADRLVSSFESCASIMKEAGAVAAKEVTVPVGDFIAAVFAFGSTIGVQINVA